jgi:hypothetical protein
MNMTRATTHPARGQTLLIFVLALTVLLGFTAIDYMRKPSSSLPAMSGDRPRRLERRDYLPRGPESVKRGRGNFATTIALVLAVCVIAFFLGLVIAMDIRVFN